MAVWTPGYHDLCVWRRGSLAAYTRFISPGEKEVATAVLEGSAGAVILMKPDGFGEYFKPHGRYFDLCAQGRLLILACRPPVEVKTPFTREMCLNMNAWCRAIAEGDVQDRL